MNCLNKEIGALGEDLAEKHIKNLGYIIVQRNFSCKIGEIDIIAKDNKYITFIEVKTRYDSKYGLPAEAVTKTKQYKIYKTAQFYIMKNKLYKANFRFDVIEIILSKDDNRYKLRLIKDAFQV